MCRDQLMILCEYISVAVWAQTEPTNEHCRLSSRNAAQRRMAGSHNRIAIGKNIVSAHIFKDRR